MGKVKIAIIPEDSIVVVDKKGYSGLDLSFLLPSVHAVQWYGAEGEVEYVDAQGRPTHNETITDFTPYQPALDAWQAAKAAEEAEEAAAQSAESVLGDSEVGGETTQSPPSEG